jgi:dihydroorotate dehydrogenase electron transfer subunit
MVAGEGGPMQQFDSLILANRPLAPGFRELVLEWRTEAGRPRPGQFLSLRVSQGYDPLLRRPFAFSGFSEAEAGQPRASIIYQVRGRATLLLADLAPGASVDLLGPLGNGFPEPAIFAAEASSPLLAAGGIGLGPVLFLATELEMARRAAGGAAGGTARAGGTAAGMTAAPAAPFVIGFRTAGAIPDIALPEGAVLCTDDGSRGFKGTALDWIAHNAPEGRVRLCGCGPSPMLAALAAHARARGWEASLSAEQWMACGVGACMGCALPARGGGFLRACADGPVFERDAIEWARGASA